MTRRRSIVLLVTLLLIGATSFFVVPNLSDETEGRGRLRIEITELPNVRGSAVMVAGPSGFDREVSGTTTLQDLPPGPYTISAEPVEREGATFYPAVTGSPAVVRDGTTATAEVSYRTQVANATRVLEDETLDSLLSVSDDQRRLLFDSERSPLQEDDIVVAGVSAKTPQGLLRRVTEIDEVGNGTVVRTEQASLDEAVTRGELSLVDRSLAFHDVERAEALVDGVGFREGSLVITIEGSAGKGLSIACGPNVNVEARGRIELDPGFDFSASWGPLQGLKARATVTTDERAEVSLTASGAAQCSKEIELYRLHFAPITVAIGPVPVVVTPVLTVNLDVNGEVTSQLALGATQTSSFTTGLSYDDGRLDAIKEFDSGFDWPRFETAPLQSAARASAGPRLDLLLYGVVGPSIEAEGYLRFSADPLGRPWWELFGGLQAWARMSLDVLAGRIKVNVAQTNVIDWETWLLAAEGEPPVPDWHVLRLDGVGPIRFGMTVEEAERAVGEALVLGADAGVFEDCHHVRVADVEGILFMVVEGRIVRATVYAQHTRYGTVAGPGGAFKTADGARLIMTEEALLSVYPRANVTPHEYGAGHYVSVRDGTSALMFETSFIEGNAEPMTVALHAGLVPDVYLVEGCA